MTFSGSLFSKRFFKGLLAAGAMALLGPAITDVYHAEAQQRPAWLNYPHNHLDWYTISSEH
ncbi:MAG: hypothetical protein LAT84_07950, partial [Balneolia bacterium]|nr:hypothetical protein [Balneolia bacterium]